MVIRRNSPETAEEYLRIIVQEGFAPAFAEQGYKLPAKIDIDFGFTSHGSRKGPVGEYYEGAATTNGVPKMNIRCDTADIDAILKAVGHQCLHAAVGAADGHGKKFRDAALRMQYVGSKHEGGGAGAEADGACTRSRRVPWTLPARRPQIRDPRSRGGRETAEALGGQP